MRLTGLQQAEGLSSPRLYGFSYSDYHLDCVIYHPIPFNLIVRWWRAFLWFLMSKPRKRDALNQAYIMGYKTGHIDAKRNIESAVDMIVDKLDRG